MEEDQKINKIYDKIIEVADALNSGLDKAYYDISEKEAKDELKQKLEDLQLDIKENNAIDTINDVKKQIETIEKLITDFNTQLASLPTTEVQVKLDTLLENLKTIEKAHQTNKIKENYFSILDNLYVDIQKKSSFFKGEYIASLVIATIAFVIGGWFMWDGIKQAVYKGEPIDKYLYLIPKVTFLVFLELSSLIFFRHANKTLAFLQFLNNELIVIKFKKLSLMTALASEDTQILRDVVSVFVRTEKNHVDSSTEKDNALEEAQKKISDLALNNIKG